MKPPLDDPETYARVDPRGFVALVRGFAGQIADATGLAHGVRIDGGVPRTVAVLGMGGSAVAGDILQALAAPWAPCPIQVVRDYTLPAWVGRDSVVVVSSYSGQTEETLSAFDAAQARGARMLVVTTGGELGARAVRAGLPWIRLPGGFLPRAAFAYLLMPVLAVLEGLGVALGGPAEREEATLVLKMLGSELAPEIPLAANAAKDLAVWLHGRLPVIYGTGLTAPAAYRWKTQIEENAKVLAVAGALPELNHNTIEAWGAVTDAAWSVVLLRDAAEHPRVARRAELTRAITAVRAPTREVWARGEGRLGRLLSLTLLGDWTSYYLAVLRGVDPWAIDTLEAFKRRMAEPIAARP